MIDLTRQRALHPLALTGLAGVLALGTAGCKSKNAQIAAADATGQDPADANMAQPYTGGTAGGYATGGTAPAPVRVMGQSASYTPQSSGESYETQAPAPIIRQAPPSGQVQYYPVPQAGGASTSYAATNDPGQGPYDDAEEAGDQAIAETDQAPPPLPEYDQPPAPEDDYLWTPGYWNYASAGYYWVPGAWVAPPFYGALWTPPYWAYDGGHYRFHRGYWGRHVGYYGGVNYGFGYIGVGYFGGYWHDRDFFYNRAVTNVNIRNVHNVYNRTVVYDNHIYGPRSNDRVSYNGGRGGLNVQPRPEEVAAMREAHYAPVPSQRENRVAAAANRSQFFAADHGRPENAFRAQPVGALNRIAAQPQGQPFNHPGSFGAAQPGGVPAQPGGRAFGPNRTLPSATVGVNAGPGSYAREAGRVQPGAINGGQPRTPGDGVPLNRSGINPAAAAANPNRPGEFRQPNGAGAGNGFGRSAAPQPGAGGLPVPADSRTRNGAAFTPNGNQQTVTPGRSYDSNGQAFHPERYPAQTAPQPRAEEFRRNAPTAVTNPEARFGNNGGQRFGNPGAQRFGNNGAQTPLTPQANPAQPRAEEFHRNAPNAQPGFGGRPGGFEPNRATPAQNTPQFNRPAPEVNRPAPNFTPRAEPSMQRAPAASPAAAPHMEAPRAGGGGAAAQPRSAPAASDHGHPH